MFSNINLFSEKNGEIEKFLNLYYNKKIDINNNLYWQKEYKNPLDMIEFISTFSDNADKFELSLWISLDQNIYININQFTINDIIKYIIERYP